MKMKKIICFNFLFEKVTILVFTATCFQLNAQPNSENPREVYEGKIKEIYTNVWVQKKNHKEWETQYLDKEMGLNFNEDGSKAILETVNYEADGKIRSTSKCNYKDQENKKEILLDSIGNPIQKNGPLGVEFIRYKYQERKVIEMIEENENHELQFKTVYFYENGKLIKADHYNKAGTKVNQLIYDDQERLKEQIHCFNDKQLWIKKLFYDEKGFLIREEEWNLKGKKTSETLFEYEFDSQGNWIKEWKINGNKRFYTKRDLVYFN